MTPAGFRPKQAETRLAGQDPKPTRYPLDARTGESPAPYAWRDRSTGPVFRQRRFSQGCEVILTAPSPAALERELALRIRRRETGNECALTRKDRQEVAATVWRDLGAIENDMVRREFLAVTGAIGVGEVTAPKTLRHTFVTNLQDANVDPLIRNELMGHVPAGISLPGAGLAMTAVYTHTRPETKRRQLEEALSGLRGDCVCRAVVGTQLRGINPSCGSGGNET